jgi:hypothetical protein
VRSRKVALAISSGIVLGTWALVLANRNELERDAYGSTQECNTACQTKMTDCIQRCDGVLRCELTCKAGAVDCVHVCTADGGPSSRATAETRAAAATDGPLSDSADADR